MVQNISPFSAGDKVVGYCRYSGGEEQGLKNTSTDEQEAAIRRFCEQNELVLVKVYADPFVSGRSTKGRDRYLEMMSDLLHKKHTGIVGLVAWDFERIHRNFDQAQLDGARLRMAGYKIYSIQQPIIDNSPFAKVMEAMYFASAQNQSDMISADVRRAIQNNFVKYKAITRSNIPDGWIGIPIKMGTYSDGRERIGYKAEPDPELAPKIREAIEARFCGATLSEMRSIIGGIFLTKKREAIRRLMMKTLLYGELTFGESTVTDYCTPIIDKETYDRLQIYNEYAPREYQKPQGHYSKNRALLSDLLYCGVCGKKAFIDRRTAKGRFYETYYCNDKHVGFRRKLLDDLVIEKGIELLSDDQYKKDAEYIIKQAESPFSDEPDKSTVDAEIAKIDRKIERILAVIEDSDQPPTTLVNRLSELEKQRAEFSSLHSQSTSSEEVKSKILDEADRIRKSILEVLKNKKSTTDEKRNALSLFIHSVVIYPESKVLIRHTLPGYAKVASTTSGDVSAPPEGQSKYSQLLETLCIL